MSQSATWQGFEATWPVEVMSKQHKVVSLSQEQRVALEAICRRRKVDALVWKRARAFLTVWTPVTRLPRFVCVILDIGPTRVWRNGGLPLPPRGCRSLV